MKRPTTMTVIGWILVITGGILMLAAASSFNAEAMREHVAERPMPAPLYYALTYAGFLVYIICGTGILKGWNWARYLFVIWSLIGIVTNLITVPVKTAILPGFLIFVIIALFLFRPAVNSHFTSSRQEA